MLKPQKSCSRVCAVYIDTKQLVSKRYSNKSQQILKIMLELIPKWSKNQCINYKEKWKKSKIVFQIHQFYKLGLPLWSHLLAPFPVKRVFFATWFSEPLRVTPWTDSGLPRSPLDQMFLTFYPNVGPILVQMSKTPEQNFDISETRSSKKQRGFNKNEPIINPNKIVLVVFVYQPRSSPKPQVCFE